MDELRDRNLGQINWAFKSSLEPPGQFSSKFDFFEFSSCRARVSNWSLCYTSMPTLFSLTHRSFYSNALKHVFVPYSTSISHLYSRQFTLFRAMSTTIQYGKLQQNKQPLQAYLIIGEKSKLTSANPDLVKVLPKDFADANIVHVADLVKEGKQEVAAQWVGKGIHNF